MIIFDEYFIKKKVNYFQDKTFSLKNEINLEFQHYVHIFVLYNVRKIQNYANYINIRF